MEEDGSRDPARVEGTEWRWVAEALRSGVLAIAAGLVVGVVVGSYSLPACAVVATVVFFLGWSAWQSDRLAGAAVGAGLLGCVACLFAGMEIPRAWRLEHAPRRYVHSVEDWAASDHDAVVVAEVVMADEGARAYEGTPLVEREGSRIEAFQCAVSARPRKAGGRWLVPVDLWDPSGFAGCSEGAERVLGGLRATGRDVDPRAGERLFVAFEDDAALSNASRPRGVFQVMSVLFVTFALAVVLLRKRGFAASERPNT